MKLEVARVTRGMLEVEEEEEKLFSAKAAENKVEVGITPCMLAERGCSERP